MVGSHLLHNGLAVGSVAVVEVAHQLDGRVFEVDIIGRYTEQLKVAGENAIPRPVTVVWPQQSGRIASQVNAAYAQEKTPQQAMSDLKSQLEQIENSA